MLSSDFWVIKRVPGTVGQNGRFHPQFSKFWNLIQPNNYAKRSGSTQAIKKCGGSGGGFGLFLGRNGQKLPKMGQKMPKMAIFSHFGVIDFGRFWPTVQRLICVPMCSLSRGLSENVIKKIQPSGPFWVRTRFSSSRSQPSIFFQKSGIEPSKNAENSKLTSDS